MASSETWFTTETYKPAFDDPTSTKTAYKSDASTLSTPNVSYGIPYSEACAKHVRDTFKASRVYIVTSGSMSRNHPEALQALVDALGEDKVVGVRKGMASHTLWSEILEIVHEAKATRADCLVTLGAGSITDGCKIVALCLANDINDAATLSNYHVESASPPSNVKPPTIPLICIPTSLSGGEYFSLAGGTNDSTKHKHAFLQSGMGAALVILDPKLCSLTPPIHWLPSGVRAIDHCVETLACLTSAGATPSSDKSASEALRLLVPNLLLTHSHSSTNAPPPTTSSPDLPLLTAIHASQLGVLLAMKSIRAGVPLGASHAIGHQLGPLGVPHGITSCLMCPAVFTWNLHQAPHSPHHTEILSRQERIREILWSLPTVSELFHRRGLREKDEEGKGEAADVGALLDAVFREMGQPRSLKEVGLEPAEVVEGLARRTLKDAWAGTNPVPLVREEQVREILKMVS